MNKPLGLVLKESKAIISDAINSCGLHPTLLEMIIKDVYLEVSELKKQFEAKETDEYYTQLKAVEKVSENDDSESDEKLS